MSGVLDRILAALAAVIPGLGDAPDQVFNGYVDSDYAYVAPAAPGRIASIAVEEGARVFEGQQVFTLDASHETAALHAAEARVRVAEANLANLQTGSRDPEIAVIRAELARAQADRDLAAGNLARSEQLFARGNIAAAQVDSDRAALAGAEARVREVEAQLSVAGLAARDAQRIAAEATLEAARAEAAVARAARDDRVILAPATGTVDRVFFEVGEVAGAGVPVIAILPDGALTALFFVPETRRADFGPGDRLELLCDGCPEGLTATVTRLASTPQYTPPIIYSREERARLVFRAEAALDADAPLLPGQPISLRPAP